MIKPLTSLRFIFAFLVFLSHYRFEGVSIFSEGYIGVSFFFILSGFVLSYSYKERFLNQTISKNEFYVARFARIYPLHLLTLLPCFAVIVLSSSPIEWGKIVANVALIQSWVPIKSYYFSLNAPSWSISDEMFFYLLFPFLVILLFQTKRLLKYGIIIALLLLFVVLQFFIYETPNYVHAFVYINPLFRLLDFIIGIFVYQSFELTIVNGKIIRLFSNVWRVTLMEVTSLAILVIMIVFSYDFPQIIRYSSYYWMPMALIIYIFSISGINKREGYISKILSTKLSVLLGEISFGFYMLHVLVMTFSLSIFEKLHIILPPILKCIVIVTIILVSSIMSYFWFEKPINKWIKKKYEKRSKKYSV